MPNGDDHAFIPWVTQLVNDVMLGSWSRRIVEAGGDRLSPETVLYLAVVACEPPTPKLMRDPNLIDPQDPHFPPLYRDTGVRKTEAERRAPDELLRSLNEAHDKTRKVEQRENQLRRSLIDTQKELRTERKWRRWLIAALGATWVAAKLLLPYAIKGALAH